MFSWLFNLFTKKEQFNIYSVKERKIYQYFDGEKDVKEDPLIIFKRLAEVGPTLSIDLKTADIPSKFAMIARENALKSIRFIFNLKEWKDKGLMEAETLSLLGHFINYTEALKKNLKTLPISSTPTAEQPRFSLEENQTIPNSLESGSIKKDVSTEKPELSIQGQQSPLVP